MGNPGVIDEKIQTSVCVWRLGDSGEDPSNLFGIADISGAQLAGSSWDSQDFFLNGLQCIQMVGVVYEKVESLSGEKEGTCPPDSSGGSGDQYAWFLFHMKRLPFFRFFRRRFCMAEAAGSNVRTVLSYFSIRQKGIV